MYSKEERYILNTPQLLEVICQLRFPDILKIESQVPDEFQDRIRKVYPRYDKKVEQLPPKIENGKPVPQGTVNNYQFISEDGKWKVSLTKSFIALSSHQYTRWEDFAKRLDFVLDSFIRIYEPSFLSRVGLRYINAFRRSVLSLEEYGWKDLITPGYLGLMADDDANEKAFQKCEQNVVVLMPGGAKANIKALPATIRKTDHTTNSNEVEGIFMLDLDLFMDSKTELGHAVPALNVVHENARSLFRGAVTDTLFEAMGPVEP